MKKKNQRIDRKELLTISKKIFDFRRVVFKRV